MYTQKAVFEHKVDDRVYTFICNTDAPLGEVHDALMMFRGWCVERMVKAQKEHEEEMQKSREANKEEIDGSDS